jgi:hypothetical protein
LSTHRLSARREIQSIQRGLRSFQNEVGTTVLWYEFDPAASSGGDTYQEGGIPTPFDPQLQPTGAGLVFRDPVVIPVVWLRFLPPSQVQTDLGEYTVNQTSLRVASEAMRSSGLRAPFDPAAHFNDRYLYNGFLYRVESYAPRGWVHNAYNMVDVTGRQVKEEELESDTFPLGEADTASVQWTPGQQLAWRPGLPANLEDRNTPDT